MPERFYGMYLKRHWKSIFLNEKETMVNKSKPLSNKPDLDKCWFWDLSFEEIDWNKAYRTVIKRILERGLKQDWEELVRFYGKERVVNTIKYEIGYLPDHIIKELCDFYKLEREGLKCYQRKKSLPPHLI